MDINPIEATYGLPLQTAIIKMLLEFKKEDPGEEITVFFIGDKLVENKPKLQSLVTHKLKRKYFHRRIRHCLKSLVTAGEITTEIKKSSTHHNYNVYYIHF